MRIRGIVRIATLEENPPGSDQIELLIRAQGVRPEQPRLLVVPYELLLGDATLEPEHVQGKGFEADVSEDSDGRGLCRRLRSPRDACFERLRSDPGSGPVAGDHLAV